MSGKLTLAGVCLLATLVAAVTTLIVRDQDSTTPLEVRAGSFRMGELKWQTCDGDQPGLHCGVVPVRHAPTGARAQIPVALRGQLDQVAGGSVLVWRPGGPGIAAAQALRGIRGSAEVVGVLGEGRQVLAVDPPRSESGEPAVSCGVDLLGEYFATLAHDDQDQVLRHARMIAESCQSDPWSEWSLQHELAVTEHVLNSINPAEVAVYAVSFGARGLDPLASTMSTELVVLDSPSPISVLNGSDFVGVQVDALLDAWDEETGGCGSCQQALGEIAIAGSASLNGTSAVAAIAGLLRSPGHEPEDVTAAVVELSHGRVSPMVAAASSQTLRRFGDDRYSPLNVVFWSQVCPEFHWDEERMVDLLAAQDNPLARFLTGVYLPCVHWPHGYHLAPPLQEGQARTIVLSSRLDPVVPWEDDASWRSELRVDAEAVFEIRGHGALVPRLPGCARNLLGLNGERVQDGVRIRIGDDDRCTVW